MTKIYEPQRETPLTDSFDVVICGGGPAGIAAALASARGGAKTCLIESNGCLGGIWTSGLLCYVLDSGGKRGILNELFERLDRYNARSNGILGDVETMKVGLEEICLEEGVNIRLYTRVVAAYRDSEGKRLTSIVTESKSGREAWQAKVFIDTTGDGDLAALAGCGFDFGEEKTSVTQPMSLIALVTADAPERYQELTSNTPARGIRLLTEATRAGVKLSYERSSMWHIRDKLYILMANHQYGYSGLRADHLTEATIHGRKEVFNLVEALRSLGERWSNLRLVATGAQIGVREGRRIHGRYTVTVDDIIQGKRHEDAVCRVNFNLDVHSPDPDEKTGMAKYNENFHHYRAQKKPYDIPMRALIAKDVDGLLMAGRCISGDFLAHSSYRVTGNAVVMGQAAGSVAALAVHHQVMPHKIGWSELKSVLADSAPVY